MISFFGIPSQTVFLVESTTELESHDIDKLCWLFGESERIPSQQISGNFIGPRAAMITPWSTNAVEITQNMGIPGLRRIEKFQANQSDKDHDPMIFQEYIGLDQETFTIDIQPEPIRDITDIDTYNKTEGLALSQEEVTYLEKLAEKLGRPLTDSEVFGFSQVNSEHCRHKIFNGTFVIDGEEMPDSLFQLIKKTSKANPNQIVSAYKDNVAFIEGPEITLFRPDKPDEPDFYKKTKTDSVISLKAETHNFPTTVEPFNGAATGSGGEIRDRLAGGRGSIPLAGTALYMTAYPRNNNKRNWVKNIKARNWKYQSPLDILIKASNGASDFGNKFGQPLINGSLLTFEHDEKGEITGFDKVIMQAGGIGYAKAAQAAKNKPQPGDRIVILGGDNYRIGMGGAAVSSTEGGAYGSGIELNAVQRSNPEMQKRVANTIRALVESDVNPICSIHDHGAGGHLNCLSELVEETGGVINLKSLPIGDPTLSAKEIVGNESQERMGLVIKKDDLPLLKKISERERSPIYDVGEVRDDMRFSFVSDEGKNPIDLSLEDMFGSSPKTVLNDKTNNKSYDSVTYSKDKFQEYLEAVLRLESVACKDWLTNKVDRSVGGLVAIQQCTGPLQLPLNNCGVMALDYDGLSGIATSMGHAPIMGLIDARAGSRYAITEALTNIIWAPLENGLSSVSLSANWMWPAKNEGEDSRLYEAVKGISDYAIELGINVPTGKDSLSMKQKYEDKTVLSPGTVVITAVGHCADRNKVVEPYLQINGGEIYYINLSMDTYKLGGSAFAQVSNKIGTEAPQVNDSAHIKNVFDCIQELIKENQISAGHDISAGGLITCLLELCFPSNHVGAEIKLDDLNEEDTTKLLFSENSGLIIQSSKTDLIEYLEKKNIHCIKIGSATNSDVLHITNGSDRHRLTVSQLRDIWYETSFLMDKEQSGSIKAKERYDNYSQQPLAFNFPTNWSGEIPAAIADSEKPIAAVLREKGSNSEREMAHALYLAGFQVRDVHMTDLMSGRETLEDVHFLGAVGGFSNSDVLGSAKGWAGAILYNEEAKKAIDNFFKRDDVLSIGICNGCQLFMELNLINPEHDKKGHMTFNDSHKHESNFTSVTVEENNSVMLSSLSGSTLGVWISHGEGKFVLPENKEKYNLVGTYGYKDYPSNPNGSDYNAAMIASEDGRHLVTMPHIERSIFKWNWAYYEPGRENTISPWIEAFVNARNWIINKKKNV